MFSKLILDKQISFGLAEYKVILKRNFSHALSLVTEEFTLFVASWFDFHSLWYSETM